MSVAAKPEAVGDGSRRDLTKEQNEAVRELLREMLATRYTQAALGRLLDASQSTLSGFLNGRQGTSHATARRICQLARRHPAEFGLGADDGSAAVDADFSYNPPMGTLLMRLRRLPGLEEWLEENPTRLTVRDFLKGLSAYQSAKPASRSDGEPMNGWGAFFDDALSGRLEHQLAGDVPAAEALELRQMTPAGRRRVSKRK